MRFRDLRLHRPAPVRISLAIVALATIASACGGGNAPEPEQFLLAPAVSSAGSANTAFPSDPAEEFTGAATFADLPDLCRRMVADYASYPGKFGWRGCALCTRAAGMSLADSRASFEAASDRAFLEARKLERVANDSRSASVERRE